MAMPPNLQDIKVGDYISVFTSQGPRGVASAIRRVTEVKVKWIVDSSGSRWNRETGNPVPRPSTSWVYRYAVPTESSHREAVAREHLRRQVGTQVELLANHIQTADISSEGLNTVRQMIESILSKNSPTAEVGEFGETK